ASDVLRVLGCLILAAEVEGLSRARRTAPPVYPLLHFRSDPVPFLAGVPIKPLHLRGVQCLSDAAGVPERLDGGCRVPIHHALSSGFAEGLILVCEFPNQAPHVRVLDGVDLVSELSLVYPPGILVRRVMDGSHKNALICLLSG